ncbi:AAA domain-containing protein [Cryptosporidium ubiquitum]|uniref:AAA domain-containing protein n=1 Tax=Cryptosporidium ubiquitum TaxID=857276 RepID=A0A1J4MAY1_9CRYT|nr:AAA domain-containing protein [Cryptosporidium ubiquitum]OII71384.1 AAA domain-containing protein [Cryptosporidium ubiquitum]
MGMLRFISRAGDFNLQKRDRGTESVEETDGAESIDGKREWKYGDENNFLQEKNVMEVDDTLRGVLIKNLYSMDIQDEVIKGILGEGNTSFKPGDILGIMGSLGSGKSLLIMHMVAVSILPEEIGGHDQKVYYLDTDSGFSIEVFIEKHLIPIIEKKIVNEDFYYQLEKKFSQDHTKIPQESFSKEKRIRAEKVIIDKVIRKSLNNLYITFVNDLLDLLCILRQIISDSHINSFNNSGKTNIDTNVNTNNSTDNSTTTITIGDNNHNNKAKLLVIDSLNFWNTDLSSFLIKNHPEKVRTKYHVLGYYTNKNTLFNSVFSLIRQIVQFHGFIGLISICEEPIIQFTCNNNNGSNSYYDKFKSNFTEELVELVNLFQTKKLYQNVDHYYENYVISIKDQNQNGIQIEDKKNEKLMLKFPRIIHKNIFPTFLSKIIKVEDYQSITNIIWISRSSLPISDQIHNYPNSCVIPTYFSCISVNNLQKSYLVFDDFHGLVVLV